MTYLNNSFPQLLDENKEEMSHLTKATKSLYKDLLVQNPEFRAKYSTMSVELRGVATTPGATPEGTSAILSMLGSTDKIFNQLN